MRNATIQVYKFSELSETAQKKVLEKEREFRNQMGDDSDLLADEFREVLKDEGLPIDDVRFRLSCSQGDGVAFYGDVDLKAFFAAHPDFRASFPGVLIQLDKEEVLSLNLSKRNPHYDHHNSMEVEANYDGDLSEDIQTEHNSFVGAFTSHIRSVSISLEQRGTETIVNASKDEYIKECLDPEREYTEDGEVFTLNELSNI